MSEAASHGLGSPETDLKDFLLTDIVESIPLRIVVFSGKGGVGKTTVAVNLAHALGQSGRTVGLLDADITGPNVLQMMGINEAARGTGERILPHEKGGVRVISLASMLPANAPVIMRGPMRSKVIEQLLTETEWADTDTLVVDLPPGTGDEVLTIAQRMAPQIGVIVSTPQAVARSDAGRAVGFAKKLQIPRIEMIENMSGFVCPHCGQAIDLFGEGNGPALASQHGVGFLGALPIDPQAPTDGDTGCLIMRDRPESPVAKGIAAFAGRLLESES